MSTNVARKVSQLRDLVNSYFCLEFEKNLIRQNERGIANLEEDCPTDTDFVNQIGTLAILVDDFDGKVIRSCLKEDFDSSGSINCLEKFLEENNLRKENIIRNFRYIKKIRNNVFPIHRGTSDEFLSLMQELGFKSPYDWDNIWKTCIGLYVNGLAELRDQLAEYLSRIHYQRDLETKRIETSQERGNVIYLNDVLYKYRVLVPTTYKRKTKMLVDYLTAAIIAYDKKLKSMDYALKKYVIPLKDKFREHKEDIYFVTKRRFANNSLLKQYNILLSRDDIGIANDEEFIKYFRHVHVSIMAYHMGITLDWFITHYAGYSWLTKGDD